MEGVVPYDRNVSLRTMGGVKSGLPLLEYPPLNGSSDIGAEEEVGKFG